VKVLLAAAEVGGMPIPMEGWGPSKRNSNRIIDGRQLNEKSRWLSTAVMPCGLRDEAIIQDDAVSICFTTENTGGHLG